MILTLFFIHFLAAISPGPDFLIAVKIALGGSRRAIFGVATGISAASAIHIFYSIAGLGLIISNSIFLFSLFKIAGATYLIFLGISAIFSKKSSPPKISKKIKFQKTFFDGFKSAFFTNLFNPKAAIYYTTLFSVFLNPADFSFFKILVFIFGLLVIIFFTFLAIGLFLSAPRISNIFLRFRHFLDKIFGAILIFLGIRILTFSQKKCAL